MDFFPAGTFIPPHRMLATFLALCVAFVLGMERPDQMLPLLLLCLPMSWLGTRLDAHHRTLQNKSYDTLLQRSEEDMAAYRVEALVGRSLLQLFAMNAAVFFLAFLLLCIAMDPIQALWPSLSGMGWAHLWAVGLIGAILSLRIRIAYGVLIIGAFVLSFFVWW
jgi:PTS system mannose-specific IIC component